MSNEDLKIFLEDLVDYLHCQKAGIIKLKRQIEKLLGSENKAKISEENFSILKWQSEKGSRLGVYEVAYKNQNILNNWVHAFNILKANNSVIGNPFYEENYQYRYWIYPDKHDDRIYRKRLNKAPG